MKLEAVKVGKRFSNNWIFRDLSFTFEQGNTYAVTGPNGSGKSTLLKILWGQLPPTAGSVRVHINNTTQGVEELYQHVSIATPYLELVDEFTLAEMTTFHFKFKKPQSGMRSSDVIAAMELESVQDKFIGNFSSGMKQRVKLGLAFLSDTPLLFLDEPTTNLDQGAREWYHRLLRQAAGRVVIIASNQPDEYPGDASRLDISTFK